MGKLSIVWAITVTLGYSVSFEHECLACHTNEKTPQLENLYFRYLQVYGSPKRALAGMQNYLLSPSIKGSIMPPQALERFGLHPPVNKAILPLLLNDYFHRYDVKKRIIFH